jgi:GT2 family glycosyltransferase
VLTVSLIIPVCNGGEVFRRCLESVRAATPSPSEIIVVANGDMDGSSMLARQFGAHVIAFTDPMGPARARNIGAGSACGDLLFFVDADVTIPEDAVTRIREIFCREPELAAVFGSYDDTPGATNFLSQYKNLFHHYVHQTSREVASTFWGACGAVRRDVFQAMGGFDVRYRRPSIEDIEFGYRLRATGHRIRLCKDLQVKHWKRWEIFSLLNADFWYRAVPWTQLILRDRRFVNDLNLRTAQRLSVMAVYGLIASLIAVWWRPEALVSAGLLAASLVAMNAPLYRFFHAKRGLSFTLRMIPWHWLYFFYSGLALTVGLVRHCFTARSRRADRPTTADNPAGISGDLK